MTDAKARGVDLRIELQGQVRLKSCGLNVLCFESELG